MTSPALHSCHFFANSPSRSVSTDRAVSKYSPLYVAFNGWSWPGSTNVIWCSVTGDPPGPVVVTVRTYRPAGCVVGAVSTYLSARSGCSAFSSVDTLLSSASPVGSDVTTHLLSTGAVVGFVVADACVVGPVVGSVLATACVVGCVTGAAGPSTGFVLRRSITTVL